MKKINEKLRYSIDDGFATLYARRKGESNFTRFATCHIASVEFIRKNGVYNSKHLINIKSI